VNIELRNLQKKHKVDERMIKGKASTILTLCGLDNTELSILIVNNKRIRRLNKRYRGIDRPTDVLAFPLTLSLSPLGRGKGEGKKEEGLLGDKYTQHYDQDGTKTGYSENKEGILGDPYIQHYDQEGKKKGESEDKT